MSAIIEGVQKNTRLPLLSFYEHEIWYWNLGLVLFGNYDDRTSLSKKSDDLLCFGFEIIDSCKNRVISPVFGWKKNRCIQNSWLNWFVVLFDLQGFRLAQIYDAYPWTSCNSFESTKKNCPIGEACLKLKTYKEYAWNWAMRCECNFLWRCDDFHRWKCLKIVKWL